MANNYLNGLSAITALSQMGRYPYFWCFRNLFLLQKRILGVNYQKSINQDLSGGELKANTRLNVHFTILI